MEKFETYMMKHGEHGVQSLLEVWERHNGVKHDISVSLEKRWDLFLNATNDVIPTRIAA